MCCAMNSQTRSCCDPATALAWTTLPPHSVFVVPLLDEPSNPPASRNTEATDLQGTT